MNNHDLYLRGCWTIILVTLMYVGYRWFILSTLMRACRYHHFTGQLANVGIKCLRSNAGLYVWMNLQHLLKEATTDGELKLWRSIINQVKINVSPGSSFQCSEPGWFRVCFANMDDDTLKLALDRIRCFVSGGSRKKVVKSTPSTINKKRGQMELRLSFTGSDNLSISRHGSLILSPHSPVPQSPLVKART